LGGIVGAEELLALPCNLDDHVLELQVFRHRYLMPLVTAVTIRVHLECLL
jgi:hypothetical protein